MQQTINIPEGFELVQTSETTFEIKKKNILPNTWNKFIETYKGSYCYIELGDIAYAMPEILNQDGFLAFLKLLALRDCYNGDWKPDWESGEYNYTIYYCKNSIVTGICSPVHHVLSFKTSELRDMFLMNFKDLIETAKDFI